MALWVYDATDREVAEYLQATACVLGYDGRNIVTPGFGGWNHEEDSLFGVGEEFRRLAIKRQESC